MIDKNQEIRYQITIVVLEARIYSPGLKLLKKFTEVYIILEDYYGEKQDARLKKKKKQMPAHCH